MKPLTYRIMLVTTLGLLTTVACVSADCTTDSLRIDDRVMLRLQPSTDLDAWLAIFRNDWPDVSIKALEAIPGRPIHLLSITVPPAQLEFVEAAIEDGYPADLTWGEFLYENETPEGTTGSTFVDSPVAAALYPSQYAVQQLELGAAHGISTGAGTVVAVIDTGIAPGHPLFDGLLLDGADFVTNGTSTADEGNGIDDDGDGLIDEMAGHGTFVAGLVTLVAPAAKLLPVRVLDDEGRGDMWSLARGMFHAIDAGVEVINVSISSTYKSNAVEDAADEASALGIAVVTAAGNCAREEPEEYPGMLGDEVIGVAALDDADAKAGFSNFSEELALSAPGATTMLDGVPDPARAIFSAVPTGYAAWEGTSMAAPLVAGAAALVRAQHPTAPASAATYFLVRSALTATAADIDAVNGPWIGRLGAGRIDAAAATSLAPPAPAAADVDGSGTVDVNDLLVVIADWGLTHSRADIDGSGEVAVGDLVALFTAWG